ncbi:unnamed protein product [Brassica rapa]|uniref:Uncharacterized protein n=1 Tax=Brassica campestris TaxID=3711 RepID=A0A8D9DFP2_BRACM|nr:unnamed protein product [Brassica rapa]
MAITRSRFKLYGLEQRRFGEFNEVTEESEFQNPTPVTKAINLSRRFELRLKLRVEMVVDTGVEVMVVMDTEAMDTKVDTKVETMVTIDTVNEVVWLWI